MERSTTQCFLTTYIDQARGVKHIGRKLPIHELLYPKANIEKLRLRTAFNSMDYNGLAPSIGVRQSSTTNNLSYKNSLDSNLSKTSSCDQEFPRKGSSDTIALDGDLFLQSRSGSFTQTRSGSFTQFTQTRSGSFTQRLARSASNASTTLISNIRKRVLATHNFIRVC